MYVSSTQDFMYLAIAIAVLWVGGMLCWALYELGKMLHQANAAISDTRKKVQRIESAVMSIKEHFSSLSGYVALLAQAGKAASSYFGQKKAASGKKKGKKSLEEIFEEEE